MIPNDPAILLSFVNTKLRDEYAGLDELCAALDTGKARIESALAAIDYHYDPKLNKFV